MKIVKSSNICLFCGCEKTLKYEEYTSYYECDCKDAVKDRKILDEIRKLEAQRPKEKYEIANVNILIKK